MSIFVKAHSHVYSEKRRKKLLPVGGVSLYNKFARSWQLCISSNMMQGLCKNIIYIIILLQFVACHFRLADSLYPSCWCRIARLMAVQVPFVGRDFFIS